MTVNEEALLHLVQNFKAQEFGDLGLEKLQRESMDRSNEHLGEARILAEQFTHAANYPFP